MSLEDFLLTSGISLLIGLILGYFARNLAAWVQRTYKTRFRRAHYFKQD
ncbi:hypothetical protein [Photobacterium sp. 1_MG-2023]|nr:hypothetical protein [Photobacterium sp. 1_MG-2023]MDO6708368.1 hypothetical protein [Photobacterium sp. 1_MG-2023]